MANKYSNAADSIKRAAVQYKQMVEVADVLDQIGSLDDIVTDSKKAAEAARKEADKAKADLTKAEADLANVAREAKMIMEAAKADANEVAKKVKRDAEEEAAEVVKLAQDKASQMLAQAVTEKSRLQGKLGALQRSIESAKGEVAKLEFDRVQAESAAADAQKKLAAVQDKIRAML